MDRREVRVAIIGAGSAGLAALREVRKVTDDVVVIEAGEFGTTCARVGCMPSKLLIAASLAARAARRAATFGIDCGAVTVDGAAVMARVRELRDGFVGNVVEEVDALPAAMTMRGHAAFDGDGALVVAGEGGATLVVAERVVIATGSRPVVPPFLAGVRHIVSDDVFAWADLPGSVAVCGAGIVGLELGQALSSLGVTVRIFGKDGRVGQLTDPELLGAARHHFEAALDFVPDHELARVLEHGRGVTIEYRADGAEYSAAFDELLVAVGRRPDVDRLNLASTSLELDDDGVPRFDRGTGQCGAAPVFIAGDAMDDEPLLHVASESGRIAGANAAAWPAVSALPRTAPLSVTFCEPQIAVVGESFAALEARKADVRIGELNWSQQGRAMVLDEAVGRLRVYADTSSGRLLGAEMFGPRSEHLAHLLALALDRRLTVAEILAMPFYHPTFEEGLRTALCDLRHALRMGEQPLPYGLTSGPGG